MKAKETMKGHLGEVMNKRIGIPGKFTVYYNTPTECFPYEYRDPETGVFTSATFDTIDEARALCEKETRDAQPVDARDTETNHNDRYCLEVYDGAPIDKDGNSHDPVFSTEIFYQ